MRDRLELHAYLCEVLGSNHVYFQPPANVVMQYPAIVYSLDRVVHKSANNALYRLTKTYSVLVIDKNPESPVAEKLMTDIRCEFDRMYKSDNLNHFSFTYYLN